MADCLSCDKFVECDADKVARTMNGGKCADYVELCVGSRKTPNVCKYCGNEYKSVALKGVCNTCKDKLLAVKRFVEVRDDLREKLGLERMGDA